MTPMRKAVAAAALVASTLTGGAIGAAVFAGSSASAQTATTTAPVAADSGGATVAPSGTVHPNEDAAHEANESAAREAQEDAGQRSTGAVRVGQRHAPEQLLFTQALPSPKVGFSNTHLSSGHGPLVVAS